MADYKCLQCVIDIKLAEQEGNGNGQPHAEPNDAVTLAPSWQQQQVGPQTAMACIALPTCADHLVVARKSALDLTKGVVLGKVER